MLGVLAVGGFGGAAAGQEDETGDAEGVVVGTEAGFPPFEMIEDGEIVGFDIDLTAVAMTITEEREE